MNIFRRIFFIMFSILLFIFCFKLSDEKEYQIKANDLPLRVVDTYRKQSNDDVEVTVQFSVDTPMTSKPSFNFFSIITNLFEFFFTKLIFFTTEMTFNFCTTIFMN